MNTAPAESDLEHLKRLAAAKSLEYVQEGMSLGLGSGSTAAIMLQMLGQRVRGGLRVCGVPSSESSRRLAQREGIPLVDFDRVTQLDLTIDGADEADGQLNLIKGGGGALLREKIVASLSRRVVIIADASKRVEHLGAFPLPVEVVQFAWRPVAERIASLGGAARLRQTASGEAYVTDEGNFILDCDFGRIDQPRALAQLLDGIPGVMEHGLFVDIADVLILGCATGAVVLER